MVKIVSPNLDLIFIKTSDSEKKMDFVPGRLICFLGNRNGQKEAEYFQRKTGQAF